MIPLSHSVESRGGLVATHELHADGHTRDSIAHAVSRGDLYRVRQGWYCLPGTHPLLQQAARVGGPATCVTGLMLHGAWTIATTDLHVAVAPGACRLRARNDKRERLVDSTNPQVRVHWTREAPGQRLLLDPLECLTDLIGCERPEIVTAIADSVLHQHPSLAHRWADLVNSSAHDSQPWLRRVDGICESGTESIFWFRMSPLNIKIRRQVLFGGIGRVDFLFGRKLVVEVDSVRYHTDPEAYERDRRRDARLSARGYRVLRFTYDQVMHRWHEVQAAVLAAIARGDHL